MAVGEESVMGESGGGSQRAEGGEYLATVQAMRDTHLVRLPTVLLEILAAESPPTVLRLLKAITLRRTKANQSSGPGHTSGEATVALVGVGSALGGHDLRHVTEGLAAALGHVGVRRARVLDSSFAAQEVPHSTSVSKVQSAFGDLALAQWLEQQQKMHQVLLYLTDDDVTSSWTRRCVRQSDIVVVVADIGQSPADSSEDVGKVVEILSGSCACVELLLLHRGGWGIPRSG
eukprot:gene25849-31632_t